MADSMAWRAAGSAVAGRPLHPASSPANAQTPINRPLPVILALILLYFPFVHSRSASQAFMFTLNLDLCGTQITQ
jgi:hypothetical protein